MAIRDGLPEELVARPDTLVATLPPRSRCRFVYRVRPTRRGSYQLRTVHVRVNSRWGLWQRLLTTPADHRLHVYPDLKQISEYALLARTDRLSLIGVRRRRRIGQDNEFERLRDYSRDDTYRHIDWRSTARRRKLTVKQYQIEQSQRIVFLVDCGRLMVNEVSGMSLLDHTFNALLMLSHIALKQGDAVGMMTFSDQVHGFVTPHAGTRQMNRLTHLAFDRFPQLVEPRFDEAFERLGRLCRKRSLLVLVTNIVDSVGASQVERHLRHVCGRHLPLAVLLRDRSLTQKADWRPDRDPPDGIYSAAVAARILCWREQLLARLKHAGCLTVDPFADELTAPLINKYLEVKARHLL